MQWSLGCTSYIDPFAAPFDSEPSIGILFDHYSAALPEFDVEDIVMNGEIFQR
jgi:hypothetical protein